MSDGQLVRLNNGKATPLAARSVALKRDLQRQIEGQMDNVPGTRFLTSEYATGKSHRGCFDSRGLDENGCPVVVEHKRQNAVHASRLARPVVGDRPIVTDTGFLHLTVDLLFHVHLP